MNCDPVIGKNDDSPKMDHAHIVYIPKLTMPLKRIYACENVENIWSIMSFEFTFIFNMLLGSRFGQLGSTAKSEYQHPFS